MLTQSSHTKYQGTAIKYKQRWSGKQMEQYNYIPGPRTQHSLSDYLIYYDISYNYYNITVFKKTRGFFFWSNNMCQFQLTSPHTFIGYENRR